MEVQVLAREHDLGPRWAGAIRNGKAATAGDTAYSAPVHTGGYGADNCAAVSVV